MGQGIMLKRQGLSPGENLDVYLQEIKRFPLLTPEEERQTYQDIEKGNARAEARARHRLFESHLRLVIPVARKYHHRYRQPLEDLISEGNIGLLIASRSFDPRRAKSFSTPARMQIGWEIKNSIFKSAGIGSGCQGKKVFFGFGKAMKEITKEADEKGAIFSNQELADLIAERLGVSEGIVADVMPRMGVWNISLTPYSSNSSEIEDSSSKLKIIEKFLIDPKEDPEELFCEKDEANKRHEILKLAMQELTDRERDIMASRLLSEEPELLKTLSEKYGVSRERIRQLEEQAFDKVKAFMLRHKSGQQDLAENDIPVLESGDMGTTAPIAASKRPASASAPRGIEAKRDAA